MRSSLVLAGLLCSLVATGCQRTTTPRTTPRAAIPAAVAQSQPEVKPIRQDPPFVVSASPLAELVNTQRPCTDPIVDPVPRYPEPTPVGEPIRGRRLLLNRLPSRCAPAPIRNQ